MLLGSSFQKESWVSVLTLYLVLDGKNLWFDLEADFLDFKKNV